MEGAAAAAAGHDVNADRDAAAACGSNHTSNARVVGEATEEDGMPARVVQGAAAGSHRPHAGRPSQAHAAAHLAWRHDVYGAVHLSISPRKGDSSIDDSECILESEVDVERE